MNRMILCPEFCIWFMSQQICQQRRFCDSLETETAGPTKIPFTQLYITFETNDKAVHAHTDMKSEGHTFN